MRDLPVNRLHAVLVIANGRSAFQAIVIGTALDHVRSRGPEVLARFPIDALALLAAMIDTF